jgi:hypothetical protein
MITGVMYQTGGMGLKECATHYAATSIDESLMIAGVMYQTEGMGLKEMCHTLRSNLHRRVINDYGVMIRREEWG